MKFMLIILFIIFHLFAGTINSHKIASCDDDTFVFLDEQEMDSHVIWKVKFSCGPQASVRARAQF